MAIGVRATTEAFGAHSIRRKIRLVVLALLAAPLISMAYVPKLAAQAADGGEQAAIPGFIVPFTDARRGRELFVGKGCVICHSINGVGGKVAPALDAEPSQESINVFEFSARMWNGASAMIVLQGMELGYQIEASGEELAHLARFIYDPEEQSRFRAEDIPDLILEWMVDDVYQELDLTLQELRGLRED